MIFNRFPHWLLAALSGVLIGLPFAHLFLGFLIYIALVPLVHIWLNSSIKLSLSMTYFSAIIAHTIAFYWMGLNQGASFWVALVSLIGAVFYLSVFWVIPAFLVTYFQRKMNIGLMLFPFAWITMEFVRSFGSMGFPWG